MLTKDIGKTILLCRYQYHIFTNSCQNCYIQSTHVFLKPLGVWLGCAHHLGFEVRNVILHIAYDHLAGVRRLQELGQRLAILLADCADVERLICPLCPHVGGLMLCDLGNLLAGELRGVASDGSK